MIYKQEVTVEGSTANIIQHNGEPISSENAEWIRKAIEASHQKLAESHYLSRLQSDDANKSAKQRP